MVQRKIDLVKYRGDNSTLFTGRPQGNQVREELNLDREDLLPDPVIFIIPGGTTSFNPSFFLGLLFKSIEKLGKDGFEKKYTIDYSAVDTEYQEIISDDIADGMRHAYNSINNDTGFSSFL
jgi:hypothetical protein